MNQTVSESIANPGDVGADDVTNKSILRVFCDKAEERRPVTQWDIEASIRKELEKIPNLSFSVTDLGIVDGPFVQHPVTFFVRGDDFVKLKEVADKARVKILANPYIGTRELNLRGDKKIMKPEDLAGVIVFLATDDSSFMTGQTVIVDGGPAARP